MITIDIDQDKLSQLIATALQLALDTKNQKEHFKPTTVAIDKPFLTVAEASRIFGITDRQIRRLVSLRKVEHFYSGRKLNIKTQSILDYLDSVTISNTGRILR